MPFGDLVEQRDQMLLAVEHRAVDRLPVAFLERVVAIAHIVFLHSHAMRPDGACGRAQQRVEIDHSVSGSIRRVVRERLE